MGAPLCTGLSASTYPALSVGRRRESGVAASAEIFAWLDTYLSECKDGHAATYVHTSLRASLIT